MRLSVREARATDGGVIEVWVDSLDTGRKIGTITIEGTGAWSTYVTFSAEVEPVSGQHDVFLKFVGSSSGELFRLRSITFEGRGISTSVADVPLAPTGAVLGQNYPNPFGTTATTITFSTPVPGHVRLAVYNLLGQEVATLVDEDRPAGVHTVEFDGAGLPNGAYFYQLTTGGQTAVKMMTIFR